MRSLRTGLSLAALFTGAVMLFAAPAAHAADTPLRDLAAAKGKVIGTAVTGSKLTGTYGDIAGAQFSSLTPGNAMKWGTVEPTQGSFNWAEADQIVAFAQAHNQQVRGHTLVWHSQNPSWLTNGTWTSAQLSSLLQNHISTEVGRYKGEITAWDVVNEPFNEDGTYRSTLWYNGLGANYIAQALTWAHAADPAAKLYINDYNVEGVNAKSTALYNLVKSLKAAGVPIDGVGLQAHLILGQVPATLQQNIQRFADLGVDVAITELDVRMALPADSTKLAQQKADFKSVMAACVAVTRCVNVTVWGFTDSDSWVDSTFPGYGAATPYDAELRAETGVLRPLGGARRHDHDPADRGVLGDVQRGQSVEHRVHRAGDDRLFRGLAVVLEGELDVRRGPADHPGLERDLHPVGHGGELCERELQRDGSGRRFGDVRVQRVLERKQPGTGGDPGMREAGRDAWGSAGE
jgi:endo-1,4-beta-xylanase